MNVEKLMTSAVAWCRPDDSLDHAAELMWHRDCGALPVCESGDSRKVIAMVTDRDICMHAHFQKRLLGDLQVRGAMSHGIKSCRPTDSVVAVEQTMREAGVRRLPVVDDSGALLGIIALADLAREAVREENLEHPDVTEGEVAVALAKICSPRLPVAVAA
jgi:CBS domain-containing protein